MIWNGIKQYTPPNNLYLGLDTKVPAPSRLVDKVGLGTDTFEGRHNINNTVANGKKYDAQKAEEVKKLIGRLGVDNFSLREEATQDLLKLFEELDIYEIPKFVDDLKLERNRAVDKEKESRLDVILQNTSTGIVENLSRKYDIKGLKEIHEKSLFGEILDQYKIGTGLLSNNVENNSILSDINYLLEKKLIDVHHVPHLLLYPASHPATDKGIYECLFRLNIKEVNLALALNPHVQDDIKITLSNCEDPETLQYLALNRNLPERAILNLLESKSLTTDQKASLIDRSQNISVNIRKYIISSDIDKLKTKLLERDDVSETDVKKLFDQYDRGKLKEAIKEWAELSSNEKFDFIILVGHIHSSVHISEEECLGLIKTVKENVKNGQYSEVHDALITLVATREKLSPQLLGELLPGCSDDTMVNICNKPNPSDETIQKIIENYEKHKVDYDDPISAKSQYFGLRKLLDNPTLTGKQISFILNYFDGRLNNLKESLEKDTNNNSVKKEIKNLKEKQREAQLLASKHLNTVKEDLRKIASLEYLPEARMFAILHENNDMEIDPEILNKVRTDDHLTWLYKKDNNLHNFIVNELAMSNNGNNQALVASHKHTKPELLIHFLNHGRGVIQISALYNPSTPWKDIEGAVRNNNELAMNLINHPSTSVSIRALFLHSKLKENPDGLSYWLYKN